MVVVAFWGFRRMARVAPSLRNQTLQTGVLVALVAVSISSVFAMPHVEPYHSDQLATFILGSEKKNPLVLVSGTPTLEGAVISSFAEQDASMTYFVVRGSQVLSESNFMGTEYKASFNSPATMAGWIKDNEIGWIIEEKSEKAENLPDCRMLEQVLRSGILDASLVASVHSSRNHGVDLYLFELPAVTRIPKASDQVFSRLKPSKPF